MKLSIIVPVYNDQDNVMPLYNDLKEKVFDKIDDDYELVFVNDGSKDDSFDMMKKVADMDPNVKVYSFSKNFGHWKALLCGFTKCTGDFAINKSVDCQEPSELLVEMLESWKRGNKVVLASRKERDEGVIQSTVARLYYGIVRKIAFSTMPKKGFDIFGLDRKAIDVMTQLDTNNTSIMCQVLWLGFKTEYIPYHRYARTIGESHWSVRMKIRLAMDTVYNFSTVPVKLLTAVGSLSVIGSVIWGGYMAYQKFACGIDADGWNMAMALNLATFGVVMLSLGLVTGYLWRMNYSSKNRPQYIVEEEYHTK